MQPDLDSNHCNIFDLSSSLPLSSFIVVQMHQEGDGSQDVREEWSEGRPVADPEGGEGFGGFRRRRHTSRRHVSPPSRL